MMKVYLFNEWHNGDVITNRALIKELLKYDLELAVGSYTDRHYLVADLPVRHIIHPGKEAERQSLSSCCPESYLPINTWCGTFPDIDAVGHHNWWTIVETFNRQSGQSGLGVVLSSKETPMIDFEQRYYCRLRGRPVYVENGTPRSNHCDYHYDMRHLGEKYPEFTFYCTANPACERENVIDCSERNLVELSFISNQCEAILGKGSGPFLCTYTEVNRLKPRAVMRFRAPRFWEYRNNPLRYLESEDELYEFLDQVKSMPVEHIGFNKPGF
jgi:hypothetical protein